MKKATLIVDGNWILQTRLFIFKKFRIKYGTSIALFDTKEEMAEFTETMINSYHNILNQFTNIADDVIWVSDKGSWRKEVIKLGKDTDEPSYKKNHIKDETVNWDNLFKCYSDFLDVIERDFNVTTAIHNNVEGDDWIASYSDLVYKTKSAIIISRDADLHQLVKCDENKYVIVCDTHNFFMSRDMRNKLFDNIKSDDDFLDFTPFKIEETHIMNQANSFIIDPALLVLKKIVFGDISDNISPMFSIKRGTKNMGPTKSILYKLIENLGRTITFNDIVDDSFMQQIIETYCKSDKYKNLELNVKNIEKSYKINRKVILLVEDQRPTEINEIINDHVCKWSTKNIQ